MQPGPPRRRRARPVADAPIDELLARADDLAKGWLLALVEQLPLESAAQIPVAELARDGPGVCEAMLRSVSSDRALDLLAPDGALEPLVARAGAMAGARGAEQTSRAVDALRAVLWQAVRSALRDPEADQIGELSERLAAVAETVRGAALRHLVVAEPRASDAGPIATVEQQIDRARRSGAALSLLLIELEDTERILAVEPEAEASATFGRFAQAVRAVARRQDILAGKTEGREWMIAPQAGRAEARALGQQVARAVHDAEPWRGAPLSVSVGVAVLGEDGQDGAALMAAAEEASFAAASRGVAIAERDRFE